MISIRKIFFLVYLIVGLVFAGIAFTIPKDVFIVDNFEDGNVDDWNESAFQTTSYNAEPGLRGNFSRITIDTSNKVICSAKGDSIVYCIYGSFQKPLNQNWQDFQNGEINYFIKFSDYYDKIDKVSLSIGDVVSGANQSNKFDYSYKPLTNDWQKVSFKLNEPNSKTGDLDLENIKKIRFNINYNEEFWNSNQTFNAYIDDITLTKTSNKQLNLYKLSILSFILSIILLSWRKIKYFISNSLNVIKGIFNKNKRKESLSIIFNNVFQFLLVIYLLFLLINEFKKITFLNLNYLMIAVIIFGILTILFPIKIKQDKTKIKKKHIFFIILLGIIGAIIIYLKIKELGWLSYLISGIAGILIILLSYMVLKDEDNI